MKVYSTLPVVSPDGCLCPGLDIGPGSHVLMLLLYPVQLGVTVLTDNHDIVTFSIQINGLKFSKQSLILLQ
jgi:hypothetical protein